MPLPTPNPVAASLARPPQIHQPDHFGPRRVRADPHSADLHQHHPARPAIKRLPSTPSTPSRQSARANNNNNTATSADSPPTPVSPSIALSHNITTLIEEPLFMHAYLASSPAPVMPLKLALSCNEPTIVFGDLDWSIPDMHDDEEDFSIVEGATAVRMVSAGRPTLVQLLKRGHSIDRTDRLPLKRPTTPARSAKRALLRTPSRETVNSNLSSDRKTFSTIDTLCRTPALSHDDDDCASPTSETSEEGPHTPSEHSFTGDAEPTPVPELTPDLDLEPLSAASDSNLLLLADQDSSKQRSRMSRLRLFSRRSTATFSQTPGSASAPASPLGSPSRLSLTTNLSSMRSKLVARGAAEREGSPSDLAADLAALDSTSAKPTGKRQRIRRIESRLGLNGQRS